MSVLFDKLREAGILPHLVYESDDSCELKFSLEFWNEDLDLTQLITSTVSSHALECLKAEVMQIENQWREAIKVSRQIEEYQNE